MHRNVYKNIYKIYKYKHENIQICRYACRKVFEIIKEYIKNRKYRNMKKMCKKCI